MIEYFVKAKFKSAILYAFWSFLSSTAYFGLSFKISSTCLHSWALNTRTS